MCDPFGPNDARTNMFLQREKCNVRVVVYLLEWWQSHGKWRLVRPDVGVYCLAAGAGAILFANVSPYIATVIPMSCVSAIWMRYPFGGHFLTRDASWVKPRWVRVRRIPRPKTQNRMVQHMGPGINPSGLFTSQR
jgi:hypothetical protein